MSNFNFVTDAKLSNGTYDQIKNAKGDLEPAANNPLNTKVIDGWNPILVKLRPGEKFSDTFGAQLYEKDGQYKVVYRGTEGNLEDWMLTPIQY